MGGGRDLHGAVGAAAGHEAGYDTPASESAYAEAAPHPPPRATTSSSCVHRRAPYWRQRALAWFHVASCKQPPIPVDELPQTPSVESNVQPI